MPALPSRERMYRALTEKDASFDGVFIVGVKTTGIFCRPVCPARLPKLENIEFFARSGDALFAGYRPCKRCRPLDHGIVRPEWVEQALRLIEENPKTRIKDWQIRQAGLEPSRLRRWFQQNMGMTFHAYARGRRLGLAWNELRKGQDVMETAMDHGFESTSGFREAFERVFGSAPSKPGEKVLQMRWIETPLGAMIAAADDKALCLLEFVDRRMMETQLKTLQKRLRATLVPGGNEVLSQVEAELNSYFQGELKEFKTPLHAPGTEFQMEVWDRLLKIPYGGTMSYSDLAKEIGRIDAQRAVGKANGDNRIAIIIPCHRVVKADGTLCGYGGGLWRKKRLLEIESGQGLLV